MPVNFDPKSPSIEAVGFKNPKDEEDFAAQLNPKDGGQPNIEGAQKDNDAEHASGGESDADYQKNKLGIDAQLLEMDGKNRTDPTADKATMAADLQAAGGMGLSHEDAKSTLDADAPKAAQNVFNETNVAGGDHAAANFDKDLKSGTSAGLDGAQTDLETAAKNHEIDSHLYDADMAKIAEKRATAGESDK